MVRSKIHIERTGACSVVVEAEVVDEFDLVEVDDNGDQVVMGINLTQYDKTDYSNKQVLSHKGSFEEWLETNYADDKSTSKVLRAADLQKIKEILEEIVTFTGKQSQEK
jgi:hypothetical protein